MNISRRRARAAFLLFFAAALTAASASLGLAAMARLRRLRSAREAACAPATPTPALRDEASARLWDRHAREAVAAGARDTAILSWLNALRLSDTDERRREAGELMEGYGRLLCTLGFKSDWMPAALAPGGERALVYRFGPSNAVILRLWDTESCALIGADIALPQDAQSVQNAFFSDDGQSVVVSSSPAHFRVRLGGAEPRVDRLSDAEGSTVFYRPRPEFAPRTFPSGVRLEMRTNNDNEPSLILIDAADRRPLIEPIGLEISPAWSGMTADVEAEIAGDGTRLVILDGSGSLRVWDVRRPSGRAGPIEEPAGVTSAAFDGDGKKLAVLRDQDSSAPARLQIFDVASGRDLNVHFEEDDPTHGIPFVHVEFSADGRALLLDRGSAQQSACVYDVATGKHLFSRWSRANAPRAVAFSPKLDKVVTVEKRPRRGTVIRIRSLDDGRDLAPELHNTLVSVVFGADGQTVGLVMLGEAAIWNAAARRLSRFKLTGNEEGQEASIRIDVRWPTHALLVDETTLWFVDALTGRRQESPESTRANYEWSPFAPAAARLSEGWADIFRGPGEVAVRRYLPGAFAVHFNWDCTLCAAIARLGPDGVTVHSRDLEKAEGPPVAGTPSDLLAAWTRRLGPAALAGQP